MFQGPQALDPSHCTIAVSKETFLPSPVLFLQLSHKGEEGVGGKMRSVPRILQGPAS